MTIEEIIDGLQFTIDMFLFNPSTGEIQPKHLLNEDSRLTVDACEGAIDTMRKYQQLQADYEARLKADMVAMLTEIQLEIKEKAIRKQGIDSGFEYDYEFIQSEEVVEIIQQKINTLKEQNNE